MDAVKLHLDRVIGFRGDASLPDPGEHGQMFAEHWPDLRPDAERDIVAVYQITGRQPTAENLDGSLRVWLSAELTGVYLEAARGHGIDVDDIAAFDPDDVIVMYRD